MKNIPRRFPCECLPIFITFVVETTMKTIKKISRRIKWFK